MYYNVQENMKKEDAMKRSILMCERIFYGKKFVNFGSFVKKLNWVMEY